MNRPSRRPDCIRHGVAGRLNVRSFIRLEARRTLKTFGQNQAWGVQNPKFRPDSDQVSHPIVRGPVESSTVLRPLRIVALVLAAMQLQEVVLCATAPTSESPEAIPHCQPPFEHLSPVFLHCTIHSVAFLKSICTFTSR